jgi:uncharacterized protein
MDPAIIVFGFGVGFLVGLTGIGGGSLMTPLLILIFGISPVTAIGTDISYAAVTKVVGAWRHLKLKTVNVGLTLWMAAGSIPSAVAGVWVIEILQRRYDNIDEIVLGVLAAALLVTGVATLIRGFVLHNHIRERDDFELHRRHKIAAVGIGATTGFVIGMSSAGSGVLVAIMLITVYRLTPRKVVGTSVAVAALMLWSAAIAHAVGGNVDYALAGNIVLGSIPGVVVGSQLSVKWHPAVLRSALAFVLIAAGVVLLGRANTDVVPYALGFSALGILVLFGAQIAFRSEVEHDPAEQELLRRARMVASLGDEIERHQAIEAELASRSRSRAGAHSA